MLDLLISGGTLHTSAASFPGDLAIKDGTIAAIGEPGSFASLPAARTINAAGMDVFPGFIDVHVHLELPFCGTVSCDDFEHGSRAALNGGITSLIDFAIPANGQSLADAHAAWTAKAQGRSLVDFAWHLAITSDRHLDEIPEMVARGLPTFKEFMIYETEGWNSDDARLFTTLERVRDHNGMLLVHAESSKVLDEIIRRHHTPELMKQHGARLHRETRPNFIEAEAIIRAINWCEATGGRLYIVHMSTAEGAEAVLAAQARGVPVLAETCAQYLVLDDSVFDREDGHLFACCPQVKKPADRERLWAGLGDEICIVSTDTCSFTRQQKDMWRVGGPDGYGDWTKIPMGLPGLDTLVPILYTHGVQTGRITHNQLTQLCAFNPANVMGMTRKGDLAPGLDADVTIINPAESRVVGPHALRSRADWSPYTGMTLSGFAHTVILRGQPVLEAGTITARPGSGRFIPRTLPG